MTEAYKLAYAQVEKIVNFLPEAQKDKIPNKILDFLDYNKDDTVVVKNDIPLTDQDITEEAKAIIANIYRDYLATDYEKERIMAKQDGDLHRLYDIQDIFNKRKSINPKEENDLVEYKETKFKAFIRKLKKLLRIN